MKTFARFLSHPARAKAGRPVPLTGVAQVGISGLSKVQYSLQPAGEPLEVDDPYFTRLNWRDAEILAPPATWGGGMEDGKLPSDVRGIDAATGQPVTWPMRYTIAHWAALVTELASGKYEVRCRTIDSNGIAQPLPRPFPKSGRNSIQQVTLTAAET
jgi:hypothetical protein